MVTLSVLVIETPSTVNVAVTGIGVPTPLSATFKVFPFSITAFASASFNE